MLEVRVDPKDKDKILEAKEREKETLGKPPQCMKKRTKEGDTKRRKKGDTDIIFGNYNPHFPMPMSFVECYHQMYFVTDNPFCLNSVKTSVNVIKTKLLTQFCFDHLSL